jgi:hypothetical protein
MNDIAIQNSKDKSIKYAPVLIITLCRFQHFKRCIESLAQNRDAEKTIVHIALDYPAKQEHWEGYHEIVNYLPDISGFEKIIVIKRESNYGGYRNFIDAMELIFSHYDRCIFSEDDNEFSKNFLAYMNQCLTYYEKDDEIIAVCGYRHVANFPKVNGSCIKLPLFNAWGCGFWKNKYYDFKPDLSFSVALKTILNTKNVITLAFKKLSQLWMLLVIVYGKDTYISDTMISCKCLLEHKNCMFPTITKTRNFGRDGSGTHSSIEDMDLYANQLIDENYTFTLNEITDSNIKKTYTKIWFEQKKLSIKTKYWILTRYILFRIKYFADKKKYIIKQ